MERAKAPVKRRAFEAGRRPKFLVLADASPEGGRAVRFAARRAARIGADIVIAAVVDDRDFSQAFGVGKAIRIEAEEAALLALESRAALARALAGINAETVLRYGEAVEALRGLIALDHDVAYLVLAADQGPDGPGPVLSALMGRSAGAFPVPIIVVPGALDDEEIDALA